MNSIPPPIPSDHAPQILRFSSLATTSMGLGLSSVVLWLFAPLLLLTAPTAIVCGHLALFKIKRARGTLLGKERAIIGLIFGYLGLFMIAWFAMLAVNITKKDKHQRAEAHSPFPTDTIRLPRFPKTFSESLRLEESQIDVKQTALGGPFPGGAMSVRVYFPKGYEDAEDQSLDAVLVAPAGTNLLSGTSIGPLDESSYHDETLPYAEAGMVTVFFEIDGEMDEADDSAEAMVEAYDAFRAAKAGVINARNALEFTLRRLPKVNPTRIFAAGHSSAGTLALLALVHEPRFAGCAAYAPCANVKSFHEDLASRPEARLVFDQLKPFLVRSSPITHAGLVQRPLYLFHSREDGIAPFPESAALVEAIRTKSGRDVTFHVIVEGDHYTPMIEEGIPAAIKWIKALP